MAAVSAPPAGAIRLTQYAHGGGCACKIPAGELEMIVAGLTAGLPADPAGELLVGLDDGDDAAVVRISPHQALVATTDFFTPVVDDAYDWGRIAATNALSDIYAMGGTPVRSCTRLPPLCRVIFFCLPLSAGSIQPVIFQSPSFLAGSATSCIFDRLMR